MPFTIPDQLMQSLFNYLVSKPYGEVAAFVQEIQKIPQEPEKLPQPPIEPSNGK